MRGKIRERLAQRSPNKNHGLSWDLNPGILDPTEHSNHYNTLPVISQAEKAKFLSVSLPQKPATVHVMSNHHKI